MADFFALVWSLGSTYTPYLPHSILPCELDPYLIWTHLELIWLLDWNPSKIAPDLTIWFLDLWKSWLFKSNGPHSLQATSSRNTLQMDPIFCHWPHLGPPMQCCAGETCYIYRKACTAKKRKEKKRKKINGPTHAMSSRWNLLYMWETLLKKKAS